MLYVTYKDGKIILDCTIKVVNTNNLHVLGFNKEQYVDGRYWEHHTDGVSRVVQGSSGRRSRGALRSRSHTRGGHGLEKHVIHVAMVGFT